MPARLLGVCYAGFIKRLVQDVWGVMEGLQDRRLLPPRIKHVDTIDSRTYTKVQVFISLQDMHIWIDSYKISKEKLLY